jgi:hypothetical protein
MRARRWTQLGALVGSVLSVSVAWAPPVTAKGPTTRYVDDDGHAGGYGRGCGGTAPAPTKIQDAIDAAGPGTRILICPGDYRGKVLIKGRAKRGMVIRSTEQWEAVLRPPHQTGGALIRIESTGGVVLRGLELRAPTGGRCKQLDSMIKVSESPDVVVRANRIKPIGPDTFGTCGFDNGIVALNSNRAWIGDNVIRDFQFRGIQVDWSPGRVYDATIVRNRVSFFHENSGSTGVLGQNGIAAHAGGACFDYACLGGVIIDGNVVTGLASAGGASPGGTPLLYQGIGVGGHRRGTIRGNVVTNAQTGIAVYGDAANTVENVVRHSKSIGIDRAWAHENTGVVGAVRGNTVLDSGRYGIEVSAAATVRDNVALRSGQVDCYGYSGTWIDNIGRTSEPPGICTPPVS